MIPFGLIERLSFQNKHFTGIYYYFCRPRRGLTIK